MTGIAHPVFFDENGRRARIVNVALVLVSFMCALLLVGVVYALLVTPALPRLMFSRLPPQLLRRQRVQIKPALENKASSASRSAW